MRTHRAMRWFLAVTASCVLAWTPAAAAQAPPLAYTSPYGLQPIPTAPPGYVLPPLEAYEHRLRWLEERLDYAKLRGDDDEVHRLDDELERTEDGRHETYETLNPRHDKEMMIGGIVLAGLGGGGILASMALGISLAASGPAAGDGLRAGFVVALAGGGLGVAAGIPMAVIGAKREPKGPGMREASPALLVSPGGAALRWRF